ncbi:NAD/NADP transhydrogenase subunit beta [Vibrio vulnificus]|uniref:NAD/NADP transhydrogenase subunit beta n=1 Tax=Vibrio vulnificus TaxID=672 RepID=UPI00092C8F98|nr:NAD/NADP transhydrogenase subunit beta [Vibrio vulnificus]OJI30037.1 hypothetical protein VV99743_03510 [Vibrio vulnificus]
MALELNPHAVYVGSHNLATQENLGTIEPPQWCDDLFYSGNSYKTFAHQSASLLVRLQELIAHYSADISRIPTQATIFFLLPELATQDEALKLVKKLNKVLGDTSSGQRSIFCYPYGNASFLVAFERIMHCLERHECWVLSVDTSSLFCVGSEYQLFEDIKTDSLLLVHIARSTYGLEPSKVQFDRYSSHYESGTPRVMASLSQMCQRELTELMLPLDGADMPIWHSQLHRFSPWVTENTSYLFSSTLVGQLGAGTGLYKALHAYQKQLQDPHKPFHVLQIDAEEQGLAVGILYRWSGRSEDK